MPKPAPGAISETETHAGQMETTDETIETADRLSALLEEQRKCIERILKIIE